MFELRRLNRKVDLLLRELGLPVEMLLGPPEPTQMTMELEPEPVPESGNRELPEAVKAIARPGAMSAPTGKQRRAMVRMEPPHPYSRELAQLLNKGIREIGVLGVSTLLALDETHASHYKRPVSEGVLNAIARGIHYTRINPREDGKSNTMLSAARTERMANALRPYFGATFSS
jgi:hypothetical protein